MRNPLPSSAPRRPVWQAVVALLLFVIAFGWVSWRSERADQIDQLQTVLSLSHKAIDRYLTQVESSLAELSQDIVQSGGLHDPAVAQRLLKRYVQLHPGTASVNLATLDGRLLASSAAAQPPVATLANEPSFQEFAARIDSVRRLYTGRPLFGPVSQRWVSPLRYVVRDDGGQAVAVLASAVPVELMQGFWSNAPVTRRAAIGLLRDDGYLISRYPLAPGSDLEQTYGSVRKGPLFQHLSSQGFPKSGFVEGFNSNYQSRLSSVFVRLDNHPLTLFVTMPTSEIYAAWWRRVWAAYLMLAVLVAVVVGAYRITRRQEARARQSLEAGESELRELLDQLSVGVVVYDARGMPVRINAYARRIISPQAPDRALAPHTQAVLNQMLVDHELLLEDGRIGRADDLASRRTLATHRATAGQVLGLRSRLDGSLRWLLNSAYPQLDATTGELRGVITTFVDITERRLAERSLLDSERRFRMLFENSLDGVLQTSPDGRIVSANPAACTLLGYTAEELVNKRREDFVVLSDPRLPALLAQRAQEGRAAGELTMIRADGSRFEAEVSSVIYNDADGTEVASLVVRDVTDRRRAEAALAAQALAERANRAKSDFVARMSHELRTPLNAILGFAQVLARDTSHPLSASQQERVGFIRIAGDHLLALINDLLDLSRIESGVLRLSTERINLDQLMREVVRELAETARIHGVVVQASPAQAREVLILGDRTRWRQVLHNLLSNAIKYNRPGGRVDVVLELQPGSLRLAVRDTGNGLTPTQLQNLFQPFERLGQESGRVDGIGIGLVITRSLVELMSGRLGVHSEPGRGSEFVVELDRLAVEAPPGERPQPITLSVPTPVPRRGQPSLSNVLYIDDEPVNRMLMEAMLDGRPGLTLRCADSGPVGLAAAITDPPDVVLLDLMMPGMSGYEVLAALRAHPTLRAVPVVAVSANAMPHEIDEALNQGFDEYLTKPVSADGLLATLAKLRSRVQPLSPA